MPSAPLLSAVWSCGAGVDGLAGADAAGASAAGGSGLASPGLASALPSADDDGFGAGGREGGRDAGVPGDAGTSATDSTATGSALIGMTCGGAGGMTNPPSIAFE